LGEFSPILAIVYFWAGFYITEVAKFLGHTFPQYTLCINYGKNGFGNILGDFLKIYPVALLSI
jgi:hypothetical protein